MRSTPTKITSPYQFDSKSSMYTIMLHLPNDVGCTGCKLYKNACCESSLRITPKHAADEKLTNIYPVCLHITHEWFDANIVLEDLSKDSVAMWDAAKDYHEALVNKFGDHAGLLAVDAKTVEFIVRAMGKQVSWMYYQDIKFREKLDDMVRAKLLNWYVIKSKLTGTFGYFELDSTNTPGQSKFHTTFMEVFFKKNKRKSRTARSSTTE